jgi:hypothetical protein
MATSTAVKRSIVSGGFPRNANIWATGGGLASSIREVGHITEETLGDSYQQASSPGMREKFGRILESNRDG